MKKIKPKTKIFSFAESLQKIVSSKLYDQYQVLLAYSGGLDSTVLLDILTIIREIRKNEHIPLLIRAVHVNHGINQNSNSWLLHCKQQCKIRNISLSTVLVQIVNESEGLESSARNARYLALQKELFPGEALLTAQHQDDQAETLLLALKRGSGPLGLSSMAENSLLSGHNLLRPLLTVSRAQIESYAKERNLIWVIDDSNFNNRFDRNFLRLKILPYLNKRWPKFTQNVTRSAQLCAEEESLLDELLGPILDKLTIPEEKALYFTPLLTMSIPKRSAILRRWLLKNKIRMPSRNHLDILWKEVVLSRIDATPKLKISDQQIRRYRNKLYLCSEDSLFPFSKRICLPWLLTNNHIFLGKGLGIITREYCTTSTNTINDNYQSINKIKTSYGNFFELTKSKSILDIVKSQGIKAYSEILENIFPDPSSVFFGSFYKSFSQVVKAPFFKEQVSIRFGNVNGSLLIVGRHHRRPLKKLWQELGVPPWKRATIPLLFYDEQLIAAIGIFVTQYGDAKINEPKWFIQWIKHAN